MKIRIATLVAVFVIGIGTLAAPLVFAQSANQMFGARVMEALNHSYLRYSESSDAIRYSSTRASISASYIIVATVKEYRRGTVIETRTLGAVEMSIIKWLPGISAMFVTIARLRTGMGARLEKIGILPDPSIKLTQLIMVPLRASSLK